MPFKSSQQTIYNQIVDFINSTTTGAFILKGYAGTGKTTMIKKLVDYLDNREIGSIVMAPTGRAAKVLRDKVGKGLTIHKGIYDFDNLICIEVESEDVSKKSFRYVFPIRENFSKDSKSISVAIVDESSMISDTESHGEFFTFGSGRLLSDLLEFASNSGIKKLVFVGDDAQLPPVTDSRSKALNVDFFMAKGMSVETATMTEVVRQDENSGILSVANDIRALLDMDCNTRNSFSIKEKDNNVIRLEASEAIGKYLDLYPVPEVGNGVIITYSNAMCYHYNRAIRRRLYGDDVEMQPGDVVLINNNNYHAFGREIFNGDMAKVVSVGELETHSNIPVTREGIKKHISSSFRRVELLFPGDQQATKCTVLESLLNSKDADITADEQRALYIDFCMRYPKLKDGSDEFKLVIREDRFFNALKVKYGYAITCHKAQGGEWETAIVDYYGQCGLSDSHLRWCYTATTRARKTLYTVNPPCITGFSKLKFSSITKVTAAPSDFYNSNLKAGAEYDNESIPVGVKMKLAAIAGAIKESPFRMDHIQHCLYMEKMVFSYNENEHVMIQAYYDKSGVFKRLRINGDGSIIDQLSTIINDAPVPELDLTYVPSTNLLMELYQRVASACAELGVVITNIKEYLDKYYVLYCLKTDAMFAYIQFYFGANGSFSTAMPKSELGEQDEKLKQLIIKI